jgi:hypothetical protein
LTAPSFVRISTAPGRLKKNQDEAIGRSKDGVNTKIHATVNALGNPRSVNAARDFLKSAEVKFPTLGNGRSALQ